MKKILSLILALSMILALGVAVYADTPEDPEYVIKIGHTLQEDTPGHRAFLQFEEEVEEKSNGRIDVEVYPNSALGGERVMYEACQMGTLEIAAGSAAVLANFDQDFEVLDLPFLFSNEEAAREALRGELGEAVSAHLPDVGLVMLFYTENGIRHITNNTRPINTPDDLKGLKIRTMENANHMASFEMLGASPTPMAFNELFTALQQKIVDGQENPLFLIKSSRYDEVQKYLSLTGHLYSTGVITINKAFWDSLPEDLQQIMLEAGENAREAQYAMCDEDNATALEYLKTVMEVNEVSEENRQLFIDGTADIYDRIAERVDPELMEIALAASK